MPELIVLVFLHVKLRKINAKTNNSDIFISKNKKKIPEPIIPVFLQVKIKKKCQNY
jgi:hypothetical protein